MTASILYRNMQQTYEASDIHIAALTVTAERLSHTRKPQLRHVCHHKTKGRVNRDWALLWLSFKYHKKQLISTRFSHAVSGVTLHLLYPGFRWHTMFVLVTISQFLAMVMVWLLGWKRWSVDKLVGPPFLFRMKYLNYWTDCHEILYRPSWFPEDES